MPNNDNKNIIFTGFMGTGKTIVGKLLAEKLSREFVDTDHLIEQRHGLTILEIAAATDLPMRLGYCDRQLKNRIDSVLSKVGLFNRTPTTLSIESIRPAILRRFWERPYLYSLSQVSLSSRPSQHVQYSG